MCPFQTSERQTDRTGNQKDMKRCFVFIIVLLGLMANAMGLASQVLEEGAGGETVLVLTRRLAELGYMSQAVSEYDDSVVSAISDFQTANGLERTGVADIDTQRLMNSAGAVTRAQYITGFAGRYAGMSYANGSSGDGVLRMQEKLKELEYYMYVSDGKFGEGTRRAVVDYQRANGLEPTGIADQSMLMRLYEGESVRYSDYIAANCAIRGDAGANVKAIQDRLNVLGYYTGDSTGTYGDNTYRAVLRFQGDNGIAGSGNVDEETYEALFSDDVSRAPDDGSMYPGDAGSRVSSMQLLLKSLGFYKGEPSGEYDINTEIAVRLFRAANGLEISSAATADVVSLLNSGYGRDSGALTVSGVSLDDEARLRIYSEACMLEGQVLPKTGNMNNGFSLVEYVYAGEGVMISYDDDIILHLSGEYDPYSARPGDIVVMSHHSEDSVKLSYAISGGDGLIARMNEETGEIEVVLLDEVDYTSISVWVFDDVYD